MAPRPRVVIVGGQFSGRRVQTLLQPSCDVTLIDATGFIEYTPSVLRCMVEPAHIPYILVPFSDGEVIHACADAIEIEQDRTGGYVHVGDQRVLFDYLVICTGSGYAAPIRPQFDLPRAVFPVNGSGAQSARRGQQVNTPDNNPMAARRAELTAAAQKLANAVSVVIVGGGPVGVELAAEVVGHFGKQKHVTLITSQQRLLHRMPAAAGQYAAKWLQKRGAALHYATRVTRWPVEGAEGATLHLSTGGTISADIVYNCTGAYCLGTHLYESLVQSNKPGGRDTQIQALPDQGIPVNDMLQVQGFSNVFACGDAIQTQFEKTAYNSELTAGIAAQNILRLHTSRCLLRYPQDLPHFAASRSPPELLDVSLYKYDAIFQFNKLVLTGILPAGSKWFTEYVQLKMAAGSWVWTRLWMGLESTMAALGSIAFT